MNYLIRNTLLALFAVSCSVTAAAQPLESLLDAIDHSNLELQALHLEYLAALERAPQVSQLPEPEAGLGVFPLPVETRLGPQWVRLSVTQVLPWKGTLPAREEVALSMAGTQYERIAAARLELRYKVTQAYYQLYELNARQDILTRSIEIFRVLESVATTRVETGKAGLADVLRIEIRIRELEEDLALLENQKEKFISTINQLLNRDEKTIVMVADTLPPVNLTYDYDELLAGIRDNHPMLRMYTLQQETSELSLRLNALEGKPSFAVGVDYINVGRRSDANPENNGRDILSPRVGIRLPIYRDKYRAREQEEKLKKEALAIRRNDQYLQFRSAIEKAYTDLEDAQIRHRLYQEQRATTQTVMDLLLTEYSNDGKGFIDLLQTENQLIQYELMLLGAIVKMHLAQAEIERYIPND